MFTDNTTGAGQITDLISKAPIELLIYYAKGSCKSAGKCLEWVVMDTTRYSNKGKHRETVARNLYGKQ